MNTSLIVLILPAALALFSALFLAGLYSELVALRNRFKKVCARIDVQPINSNDQYWTL